MHIDFPAFFLWYLFSSRRRQVDGVLEVKDMDWGAVEGQGRRHSLRFDLEGYGSIELAR